MFDRLPGHVDRERLRPAANGREQTQPDAMFDTLGLWRALWVVNLPGGGVAFGETETEAQAREMIGAHERGEVVMHGDRWHWCLGDENGWADTRTEAWEAVTEAGRRIGQARTASCRPGRGRR
jgi:hypothetical protein